MICQFESFFVRENDMLLYKSEFQQQKTEQLGVKIKFKFQDPFQTFLDEIQKTFSENKLDELVIYEVEKF